MHNSEKFNPKGCVIPPMPKYPLQRPGFNRSFLLLELLPTLLFVSFVVLSLLHALLLVLQGGSSLSDQDSLL